ncbi:CD209 antigen-like protein C [Crotalus tigris]|uniref:CD209 antigen-like protein C n=1 Tax=Crotalus tigris TaxID=88082 RepID=UPI00192F16FD|nr:CD209 antigen-like protein C [Crotalus tigris]XP_039198415.1 CD209 antigen-like protein C [Crotalus tigris]XP_039224149.1 CD209 antigen-like protein C [Crotalus tigris]XP_039224150.1 CD209 antigen-like protein C [Crotalus tigris]
MEDGEESDEDVETKGKSTFDTKTAVILWASTLMFISSLILCTLYYVHLNRITQTIQAMETIRSFLTAQNQTKEEMNDTTVLGVAIALVKELEFSLKEMEEIEESIEMIKEKKESGWKGFEGHLYYISESTMIFPEAILECKDLDSVLAPILDLKTEHFAEFMTQFSRVGVWIGLWKEKSWTWVHDNSTLKKGFWKRGAPKGRNLCVEIGKDCTSKGQCWNNIACDQTKHALCRLAANPRWIS